MLDVHLTVCRNRRRDYFFVNFLMSPFKKRRKARRFYFYLLIHGGLH